MSDKLFMEMIKQLKNFLRPYWYAYKRHIVLPIKKMVVKPLTFLPVSSLTIGPPKGFYNSTKDWIDTVASDSNIQASYTEIYPSIKICRSEPKTLESQRIHWKFQKGYQHESQITFVAEVPNGRVFGQNGVVITPDDKLLADVSVEHRRNIQEHTIFTQWKFPSAYQLKGTAAVLSYQGSDIYFHWMFDVLPRLNLLRCSGINLNDIDNFIVSSYHRPFQLETLEIMGISPTKIIENRKYPHIQAERLIVPSWTSSPDDITEWTCKFLRRSFLTSSYNQKSDSPDLIHISRSKANHRQIRNEAEVIKFLDKFGFETVVLESMSFTEQVLLLSSAKIVVGAHGAGLGNIVFCHPGTKVIEFFAPNHVHIPYWAIANQLGLDYYYLMGEGKETPEYVESERPWADISINLDSLSEIMNQAGINFKN